jgi:hypothetical protein
MSTTPPTEVDTDAHVSNFCLHVSTFWSDVSTFCRFSACTSRTCAAVDFLAAR